MRTLLGSESMARPAKKPVQTPGKKTASSCRADCWLTCMQRGSICGSIHSRRSVCECRWRFISRTRTSPRLSEGAGIDDEFTTPWEPGLRDGPTSARFAVVDYDSTKNMLTPPAIWDRNNSCYLAPDGKTVLDGKTKDLYQYHQLSVWATFRTPSNSSKAAVALGRRISWGFEGNRLIVVPHAGIRRERLLRPRQQVAAALLVRKR